MESSTRTSLDNLLKKAHGASMNDDESVFLLTALADQIETLLADPQGLVDVSLRLLDLTAYVKADAVTGASPFGDRLAGAMVALAKNGLRLLSHGGKADRLLILDGIAITGSRIARKADELTADGVKKVVAAVILAPWGQPELLRSRLDEFLMIGDGYSDSAIDSAASAALPETLSS